MAFPSPAVSVPTLTPWQWGYQGLTLGPSSGYELLKIEGLDLPSVRTGDTGRPRDPGTFLGLDLLADREITLTGQMGPANFTSRWASLAGMTIPGGNTELPLFVNVPGFGTLVTMARVQRRSMPVDIKFALGSLADFTLQFHASDPRLYATPTLNPTVGLPVPSAGFSFPLSFPLSFGGGSVAGVISALNAGNIEMRPILTVTGPCTYPSITNATATGSPTLTFGVSMATGDQLVIDTDLKTATYFSSGSVLGSTRLNTIQPGSTWFSLQPGANVLQFLSKDTAAVAGTLTVTYASAYLL